MKFRFSFANETASNQYFMALYISFVVVVVVVVFTPVC